MKAAFSLLQINWPHSKLKVLQFQSVLQFNESSSVRCLQLRIQHPIGCTPHPCILVVQSVTRLRVRFDEFNMLWRRLGIAFAAHCVVF